MTIHRLHPDPSRNDQDDPVLWDDCERCDEHAADPRSLDAKNLQRLLDVHVTGRWMERPTRNEERAAAELWKALILVERLTGESWRAIVGVGRLV